MTTEEKKTQTTKNFNGEGSVYQIQNGKWRASFTIGRDAETGKLKRTTKTFETRVLAEKWRNEQMGKYGSNSKTTVLLSNLTFGEAAEAFFAHMKSEEQAELGSAHTRKQFEGEYKKHLRAQFGGKKLSEITTKELEKHLEDIRINQSLNRTTRSVKTLLTHVYTYAAELGYKGPNPTTFLKLPKAKKALIKKEASKVASRELQNEQQISILKAVAEDPFLNCAVHIQLYTGVRVGELLALRWNDIDFAKREIRIDEALVFAEIEKDKKLVMGTVIGEPKTKNARRSIGFSKKVEDALIEWRNYLVDNNWADALCDDSIILCNRKGGYYTESGYRNRLKKYLREKGVYEQGVCPYSFRHAFADNMLEAGKSVGEIQMLMGHESVQTTFNYLREQREVDLKNSAERLDEYMTAREKKYASVEKNKFKSIVSDKDENAESMQLPVRVGRVKLDRQKVENLKEWRATRVQRPEKKH